MTAPQPLSLASLRFALVGPGRVGSSLAGWLTSQGARCERVAARSQAGATLLATALGAAAVAVDDLQSADLDLLLVAVPDPVLAPLAAQLALRPQAPVVLHTSGRHSAEVLGALVAPARALGSFHPLKAFPRPLPDPAEARGVFFATDGDQAAQALARRIGAALGGEVGEVPAASRLIYHLAATLAAGGVTTLVALAAELAERERLSPAVGRGYLALAHGALTAAATASTIPAAITGPVARGDWATFEAEVAALRERSSGVVDLVERLAAETARLVGRERTPGTPTTRTTRT
ncbi:MAG: DUF2520 domain-containing protein [Thermoanaerobaculia bacterium]|nr:DUF2520 domain-containing protein [Thermoanaerobaculia bacterium]